MEDDLDCAIEESVCSVEVVYEDVEDLLGEVVLDEERCVVKEKGLDHAHEGVKL